jgi:hypothetical protein
MTDILLQQSNPCCLSRLAMVHAVPSFHQGDTMPCVAFLSAIPFPRMIALNNAQFGAPA